MANVGDLSVQLKADDQASAKIQGASVNMKQSFGNISKGAVIASAAIVGAFGASIKSFLDTGDELHKLSQRTGIAVTSLEALGHFAELSGQDIKLFETLSKFLTKQMVSLSEGAVVQTEAFGKLGFSYQQLADLTKEARMVELIAALADIEDLTTRDIIGFDIFGGQLIKVQNLIGTFTGTEMKAFIESLKEESVWTQASADKAATFNDTIAIMQRALGGVAMELAEGHIPQMQRAASQVLHFIQTNREQIKQAAILILTFAKIVLVLKTLGFLINTFVIPAYRILIGLKIIMTKQIGRLSAATLIWRGITFATSKAMLAFSFVLKGLRLAMVGVRVATMLTYTTALLPLLPFMAGIAAIVAVVIAGWLSLSGTFRGKVVDAFKAVWEKVKSLGDKLGFLKGAWDRLMDTINIFKDKAVETAKGLKDDLIPAFDNTFHQTTDLTNALLDQNEVLEGRSHVVHKATEVMEDFASWQAKQIGVTVKQTDAVTDLSDAFAGLNSVTGMGGRLGGGGLGGGLGGGGGGGAFMGGGGMPSLHSGQAQSEYNAALALMASRRKGHTGAPIDIAAERAKHGAFSNIGGMSGTTHTINAMTGAHVTKVLTESQQRGLEGLN